MKRPLGDQVDRPAKHLFEIVREVVDRPPKVDPIAQHVHDVNIAVRTRFTRDNRPEDGELGYALFLARRAERGEIDAGQAGHVGHDSVHRAPYHYGRL